MSIPPGDEPGQAGWMNSPRFLKEEGTMRFCDGCGEIPRKNQGGIPIPLKRCGNCHHAWYHHRACQVAHYPTHKAKCRLWSQTIKNEPRLEAYPFVEYYHQQETAVESAAFYDRTRSNWDQESETWDQQARPWFLNAVYYTHHFLPICFDNDENKQVDVILDFGCATGTLTDLLRTHASKVLALDIAPKMIAKVRANEWDNVEAVAGCLVDTDDPVIRELRTMYRNKVDLIVWTTVLPYIPPLQTKATFQAFRDLLKPVTGKVCHVDFCKESAVIEFPNYITHEECETFYKWGQLGKEMLTTKTLKVKGPAGTVDATNLFGCARKGLS